MVIHRDESIAEASFGRRTIGIFGHHLFYEDVRAEHYGIVYILVNAIITANAELSGFLRVGHDLNTSRA